MHYVDAFNATGLIASKYYLLYLLGQRCFPVAKKGCMSFYDIHPFFIVAFVMVIGCVQRPISSMGSPFTANPIFS